MLRLPVLPRCLHPKLGVVGNCDMTLPRSLTSTGSIALVETFTNIIGYLLMAHLSIDNMLLFRKKCYFMQCESLEGRWGLLNHVCIPSDQHSDWVTHSSHVLSATLPSRTQCVDDDEDTVMMKAYLLSLSL